MPHGLIFHFEIEFISSSNRITAITTISSCRNIVLEGFLNLVQTGLLQKQHCFIFQFELKLKESSEIK